MKIFRWWGWTLTLKVSDEAYLAWYDFAKNVVEPRLRESGIYESMSDWAGKFPGAVMRISALLHIARYSPGSPWKKEVGIDEMRNAIRLADVLASHALAVFSLMGAKPALDDAQRVLRWIEREGKPKFKFRDCHYVHKSRFTTVEDLQPAMDILIERHFIRQKTMKLTRGRPSCIYEVNPTILEK